MPRKPPELCMFCSTAPCTCDESKPRRSRVKKAPATGLVEPGSASQPVAGAELFGDVPTVTKRAFKDSTGKARDLSYESALRVLLDADILHPASVALVREELTPLKIQDVEHRLSEWRERNGMVD